ncbi:unnamed protein product, partial [Medioppia subpectinata]
YRSDGFWRKIEFYREQPDINFKHNLILMLQLRDSVPAFKFWSTYPNLNTAFRSDQLSLPYITNREIDTNGDGKYDELNIDLNVAIDPKDQVIGAQLILFFDYRLHSKIYLQMESITHMKYESPTTGRGLRVIGNLKLNQKEPLDFSNLFLPLFIVYRSDGFWRKIEFYREQPDINFKHNLILMLQLRDSVPAFKFWSTYPNLNTAFRSDQLSLPYITNREIDTNGDGKYDELNIDLNVAIDPKDQVIGAQLILFFDYRLHSKIYLQMESITHMKYESPTTGRGLRVIGNLKLNQKEPLVYRKHHIGLNENIIGSQEFFIEDMLESYIRRNCESLLIIIKT